MKPKSITRSINMIPRSTDSGWIVTGTDWSGDFTRNFGFDLEAAKAFILAFINDKRN